MSTMIEADGYLRKMKGCSMGIFGLKSWSEVRRPSDQAFTLYGSLQQQQPGVNPGLASSRQVAAISPLSTAQDSIPHPGGPAVVKQDHMRQAVSSYPATAHQLAPSSNTLAQQQEMIQKQQLLQQRLIQQQQQQLQEQLQQQKMQELREQQQQQNLLLQKQQAMLAQQKMMQQAQQGQVSMQQQMHQQQQMQQQQMQQQQQQQQQSNGMTRSQVTTDRKKVVAKYTYKANQSSPLGVELNLKPKEELWKLSVHEEHTQWCLVENSEGQKGYVPCSYLLEVEEKVTALPWLQNKEAPPSVNPMMISKQPYISAYSKENPAAPAPSSQFYCDVCCKSFNGPQPYNAHMTSKAHHEELEARS